VTKWRQVSMALGLCLAAGAADAAVVVSETRDGGQGTNMYQEVGGRWIDSTAKSTAEGLTPNIGSRWADIGGGPQGAKARWTLAPMEDGLYDAEVTWGTSGNAYNVTYTVTADGQTTAKTLTQDGFGFAGARNGNQWISLGAFQAGPANPVTIEVSDESVTGQPDTASSGRVYADAARLVPAGAGAPAPAVIAAPAPAPPPITLPPAPPAVAPQPTAPADNIPPVTPTPAPPAPAGAASISWGGDYQAAVNLAHATGKRLLVNFVTERSRDARRMEADTWRDAGVIARVSQNFVAVRISMENQQDLCSGLGVYRSPTTLVMDASGPEPTVADRVVGYADPSELLSHLH
jgi:hypothetical protein